MNRTKEENKYFVEPSGYYEEDDQVFSLKDWFSKGYHDFENFSLTVQYAGNKKVSGLEFLMTQLPNCCGVYELGELSHTVLTDEDMQAVFTELFKTSDYKKKTFVITTIRQQKAWEAWLKNTDLFQAVKTFRNSTGNWITMWISTN